jgi:Fe-S cluster biogenesis protein NfuA/nitrite reductase/ring-hydroxylating ferredoxin subunit
MAVDSSTEAPGRSAPDPLLMMERIQELTEQLDALANPGVRDIADELTATIVGFYGAGLERIVEILGDGTAALAEDGLVESLLLVHDLHPVPIEDRVVQALERVRPYMESHGGNVELLGVEDRIARLRLQGSCSSCRASASTLELAVRQALEELAPDLEGMDVEGLAPEPELAGFPGIALPMAGDVAGPAWHDVPGALALEPGAVTATSAGAADLIVANVEGTLLAYRDRCAGCAGSLQGAELTGATLVCPACSRGFAITRAGRCVTDEGLQLEPVPLLREGDRVRVALSG